MSPKIANSAYARSFLLIKITAVAVIMLAVLLQFMVSTSQASTLANYVKRETLVASAGETADGADLGRAVAMSGDTVVVGAPRQDGNTGKVFVYVRPATGWANVTAAETATLTLPVDEIFGGEFFGTSVGISGDTIVVGASGANLGDGAVYVYVRPESGWTPTSTYVASLTHASTTITTDFFGESVAISGDTIVAGASLAGLSGKAYVFERPASGWESVEASIELSYDTTVSEENFGTSVATHADTIVVGAPFADVGSNADQGAAYVFEKSGSHWTSTSTPTEILTATGNAGDNFGISVAIREDGKAIVVGAENAEQPIIPAASARNAAKKQGAAYVYMRPGSTWASASALISDTLSSGGAGLPNDLFGGSVAISGDTIVVGASGFRTPPGADDKLATGAAFVFVQPNVGPTVTDEKDAWASTDVANEIFYDDTEQAADDDYGAAVAAFGGTAVVGVPGDDLPNGGAENQGSARVFENVGCSAQSGDWNNAATWVGDVPTATTDVCISTGHVVTLNGGTFNATNSSEAASVAARRLLVNPGAELHLPAAGFGVWEQVTNQGKLVQQKLHSPGSMWMEMLKIQTPDEGSTLFRGADISSTADLGNVILSLRTTIDWFSPTAKYAHCTTTGADSPKYAGRCFDIEPAVKDQAADVRLWALLDELNGLFIDDLAVFRFAGDWQKLADETVDSGYTGIGYINVSGRTAGFSDFLIADKNIKPTAVDLVGFSVNEAAGGAGVWAIALGLAAASGLTLIVLARRRRARQA